MAAFPENVKIELAVMSPPLIQTAPHAGAPEAPAVVVFELTVQFVSVKLPEVAIPPPPLLVDRLFSTVTVFSVRLPALTIPPPATLLEPPAIVKLSMTAVTPLATEKSLNRAAAADGNRPHARCH